MGVLAVARKTPLSPIVYQCKVRFLVCVAIAIWGYFNAHRMLPKWVGGNLAKGRRKAPTLSNDRNVTNKRADEAPRYALWAHTWICPSIAVRCPPARAPASIVNANHVLPLRTRNSHTARHGAAAILRCVVSLFSMRSSRGVRSRGGWCVRTCTGSDFGVKLHCTRAAV